MNINNIINAVRWVVAIVATFIVAIVVEALRLCMFPIIAILALTNKRPKIRQFLNKKHLLRILEKCLPP